MPQTLPNTYANGYILAAASLTAFNPVTVTGSIDLGTGVGAALYAHGPGAWDITNQGSITGEAGAAIELGAGGTVINSGFLSGHLGTYILTEPGSVTNSGTIIAVNAGTVSSANQAIGVLLAAGGGVVNEIHSQITGQGVGVSIQGGTASVVNSGTISGPVYEGVYVAGGIVTNLAGALIAGGSLAANGSIASYGWGVVIRGGGSLSNAGTVTGIGEGGAYLAGGMATNQGSIDGAWGIAISGAIGTVINSGSLSGTSQSGVFLNGGSVSNATGGTITGISGVVIKGAAGTVTNSGDIGATSPGGYGVFLAPGFTNRLIADPGATFSGSVDGGNVVGASVASTLELGAGAQQGTLSGIGTQFANFAQTTLDAGASWSFTGFDSLVAGSTLENAGTLALNGQSQLDGMLQAVPGQPALVVVGQTEGNGRLVVENRGSLLDNGPGSDSMGLEIGEAADGSGDVLVTGTNSLLGNEGQFLVGDAGLGSLEIQSGGSVTTIPDASLGGLIIANTEAASGSSVAVIGTNSTLGVTGSLVVGAAGGGSLSLAQGATVTATSLDEASASGGTGQIGIVGAGSDFIVSGTATVADQSTATFSILNGGSFQAAYLNVGMNAATGAITVGGPGTDFHVTNDMTVGTNGVFSIGNAVTVFIDGNFDEIGAVNQGDGSLIDPSTVTNSSPHGGGGGSQIVASGSITNSSTYFVGDNNNGSYILTTPLIIGTGVLEADPATNAGAEPDLVLNTGSIGSGQTLVFGGQPAEITLGSDKGTMAIAGLAAGINSFVAGDTIAVTTTAAAGFQLNGSVVSVVDTIGGNPEGSLVFANPTLANTAFQTSGALVDQVSCFAEATRIETEHGPVAVEDLSVGDHVVTADGTIEPIVWIGHRTVDCARHPRPESVWPVRVAAGAFGGNVPVRDLYLSPDHAVFVDRALVPVRLLVRDTTIAQVERRSVTYFHVELPRHAVILAEGLTVESYLDTGDRTDFHDDRGVIRLFPRFGARITSATAMLWQAHGAAPLVMAGRDLEAARATVTEDTPRSGAPPSTRTISEVTKIIAA